MCIVSNTEYFYSSRSRVQLAKKLNIDSLLDKAVTQLYDDRKLDKATRRELAKSHYEPLKEAVADGYKQVQKSFEYGTPNYEFLKQLQTNAAVFAVFKSHAASKEMAAKLKDDAGNLRSREAFKAEALKVDATYRGHRLDTEYDTAVRQARMAANWQKYEAKKKLYPCLRYIQSKAANPDAKHLAYVGIVRPVGDAFWNTHYPPNRWRCQCSVEQTDAEPTDIPASLPLVDKDFAFNSGKKQEVFDVQKSDYAKEVPAKEQPALVKEGAKLAAAGMMGGEPTPYREVYKSKNGSQVTAHPLSQEAQDYEANLKAARELANSSLPINKIEILPTLVNNPELRPQLLPDAKGQSNPDFRIDGKVCDMKTPGTATAGKSTIKTMLSNAHEQCDGIVLPLGDETYISPESLYQQINDKWSNASYKEFVMYLRYKGEWMYFDKEKWDNHYKTHKKQKPR